MIIAARWPLFGARKMSPLARPFLRVSTWIEGGLNPAIVWKAEPPPLAPSPAVLPPLPAAFASLGLGELATVNATAPWFAPTSGLSVRTVTVSPGLNGRAGMKLAPLPSEWDWRRPVWSPVREPVTRTVPSSTGPAPRKLIWLWGDAAGVPAEG